VLLVAGSAGGDATLSLGLAPDSAPIEIGETIDVNLNRSGLGATPSAGFQAFISFDTSKLQFAGANYTDDSPFSLPIIFPITATPTGEIDVASATDPFIGETPTAADGILVNLKFVVLVEQCSPAVSFRPHVPPTRMTDPIGTDIVPLVLIGPLDSDCAPPGGDGQVSVTDLLRVLAEWGSPPPHDCDIAPDPTGDGVVDVSDLLRVLADWGPCLPP
jgi:hypothetical protein